MKKCKTEMTRKSPFFLTDAQLKNEIAKCEYCAEKPCKEACPADCSPADFIMAVKAGEKADFKRAAALIMGSNPLGGVCGVVCPDKFCMKACVHNTFDAPLNIPAIQATIIQRAKELGVLPEFTKPRPNGKKVAVVGAGPSGFGAASYLAQRGYAVDIFTGEKRAGGMCNLIPDFRLDKKVLKTDLDFAKGLGRVSVVTGKTVTNPEALKKKYDAVIVAAGLDEPVRPGIPGEDAAVYWPGVLGKPAGREFKGKSVAVIGGGAVAADCAETAAAAGAKHVEMFALEKLGEMPLTPKELDGLLKAGVHVTGRIRVTAIVKRKGRIAGLKTLKVYLPRGKKFHPANVRDSKGTEQTRPDFDSVVVAIGNRPSFGRRPVKGVFYTGDLVYGPTTVVEAVAAGKNTALEVDSCVTGGSKPAGPSPLGGRPSADPGPAELGRAGRQPAAERTAAAEGRVKSRVVLPGRRLLPVPIETDFFGRTILSPFLLSAAPPSDGCEQMKKAYEAGWAGGVMKTAFDNVPIHIPGEYMFAFTQSTYGNCDNVSGHPLDRVCREVGRLLKEFPDRLTMASTGGPVTGNDEADRRAWQSNTKKLERAGAMGIEYSLSCPQGGDGTKGDIVSQDADLTAKIIGWVMEVGDPGVPKLFKLTAAVTSIYPIMTAVRAVFAEYPNKKAGVTLANTFPTLAFRKGGKKSWEEGVVVGMSGEGVIPISNLTLANVSKLGVVVSGNGGPMDYRSAADFLALGAKTVQFCTIVMKYGYGIVDDLHSGLSHLMEERGLKSVSELIGCALPNPIRGFMELSPVKKISDVNADLCEHCGNCTRCPYLAITLNENLVPVTDASRCIGCSICVQKCFSGALYMRERTKREARLLRED